MPIDSKHPDYTSEASKMRLCRDVLDGEDAVKEGGYLVRFSGMDDSDFVSYKKRAPFFDVVSRTVDGLVGAITRKDPMLQSFSSDELEDSILETIGYNNESIFQIIDKTLSEVLGLFRVGLLVDADSDDNAQPYIAVYPTECIINWDDTEIDGKKVKRFVILEENRYEASDDDPLDFKQVQSYRALVLGADLLNFPDIDESSVTEPEVGVLKDGEYHQEIFKRITKDVNGKKVDAWKRERIIIPTYKGGKPLTYIPFEVVTAEGLSMCPKKSPIEALCRVAISHFRTGADLEHGRVFTALPTPWYTCSDPKNTSLKIGSMTAWALEMGSEAGMLEFQGQGLGALENALEEKQKQMAILGSRLLESPKAAAEAYDTVRLRHSGETSVLSKVAVSVSLGLSKTLQTVKQWLNPSASPDQDQVSLLLNTDFDDVKMSEQMLTALVSALQTGAISEEAFYYNLSRGEFYEEGWTFEDEKNSKRSSLSIVPQPGAAESEFGTTQGGSNA